MIVSKTPYRISFFGGGTDYPKWSRKEGGAVLSTSIDRYCYISCRYLPPFFNHRFRVVWSYIEKINSISEILHPAVREGLRFLDFNDNEGLEIQHQGDLPARTGIGSSSTFAVGLIKALTALRGVNLSKFEIAKLAIELEQDCLKENVGSQDQIAAAFGGLNIIHFLQSGEFQVEPLAVEEQRRRELQERLVLYYSGTQRMATQVASSIVASLEKKHAVLREMRKMVDQAAQILTSNQSLDDFGRLLHRAFLAKCELSDGVSTDTLSNMYRIAMDNGALGGKVLGAGGGGFMLFYVPPHKKAQLMGALQNYLWVPFDFDQAGTTLIYNNETNTNAPLSKERPTRLELVHDGNAL